MHAGAICAYRAPPELSICASNLHGTIVVPWKSQPQGLLAAQLEPECPPEPWGAFMWQRNHRAIFLKEQERNREAAGGEGANGAVIVGAGRWPHASHQSRGEMCQWGDSCHLPWESGAQSRLVFRDLPKLGCFSLQTLYFRAGVRGVGIVWGMLEAVITGVTLGALRVAWVELCMINVCTGREMEYMNVSHPDMWMCRDRAAHWKDPSHKPLPWGRRAGLGRSNIVGLRLWWFRRQLQDTCLGTGVGSSLWSAHRPGLLLKQKAGKNGCLGEIPGRVK